MICYFLNIVFWYNTFENISDSGCRIFQKQKKLSLISLVKVPDLHVSTVIG